MTIDIVIQSLVRLQSADKTNTHPQTKLQNSETLLVLPETEATVMFILVFNKNCTYQLCKRQLADTVIIIWQYRLSAKRPILIIGASLVMLNVMIRLNTEHSCFCNLYMCDVHCTLIVLGLYLIFYLYCYELYACVQETGSV